MDENLMHYKGYTAQLEYSADDHIFFGRILGIRDMVYFQADSAKDIEREFHKAVDDYLEFCAEIGKEPQKEYNGPVSAIEELISMFPKGEKVDYDKMREERLLG